MVLCELLWKHFLTGHYYHNTDIRSEKLMEEPVVLDILAHSKPHILVDLGIGTGRELAWIRNINSVKEVIGVDYSGSMFKKLMKVWGDYPKPLTLINDDFSALKSLPSILAGKEEPVNFICLANTIGNLEKKNRESAIKNISTIMKKSDKLIPYLYRYEPLTQDKIERELYYYKKYYSFIEIVIDDVFSALPCYSYDAINRDIRIGSKDEAIYISHRWTKNEIEELYKKAGLRMQNFFEGRHAFIPVGVK